MARATSALDPPVKGQRGDDIARIMAVAGYRELHRYPDGASYVANDPRLGRVDFLFAQRRYTTAMLARARPCVIGGVSNRVIEAEDLVGLKVQSSSRYRISDM